MNLCNAHDIIDRLENFNSIVGMIQTAFAEASHAGISSSETSNALYEVYMQQMNLLKKLRESLVREEV